MIWPAGNPQALQYFQSVNRASSAIASALFFGGQETRRGYAPAATP